MMLDHDCSSRITLNSPRKVFNLSLRAEREPSSSTWSGAASTAGTWWLEAPATNPLLKVLKLAVNQLWEQHDLLGWSGASPNMIKMDSIRTAEVCYVLWTAKEKKPAQSFDLYGCRSLDQLEVLTESFRSPESQQSKIEEQMLEGLLSIFVIWCLESGG